MTRKQYIHRPAWSAKSAGPALGSSVVVGNFKTPIRSSKSLHPTAHLNDQMFYATSYFDHHEKMKAPPAFRSLSQMRLDLPRVSSGSVNSMSPTTKPPDPPSKKNPLAKILSRSSSSGKVEGKSSGCCGDGPITKSHSERNYPHPNENLRHQVVKKPRVHQHQRPPIPIPQEDGGNKAKHPPVRRVFREFSRKSLIQKVEFQSSPSLDTSLQSDIDDDNISFSSYGAGGASHDPSTGNPDNDDDYAYVYDCNFPTPAFLIKYNEPSENIYEEVREHGLGRGFESDDDGISSSKSSMSSSLSSLNNNDSGVQLVKSRKFSNQTLDFVPGKNFDSSYFRGSNDSFDVTLESDQHPTTTSSPKEVKLKPILKSTKSVPIRLGANPPSPKLTLSIKSEKKEEKSFKPKSVFAFNSSKQQQAKPEETSSRWFKLLARLPSLSSMGHLASQNQVNQKSTQTDPTPIPQHRNKSSSSSSNSQPRFEFTGRWENLH